MGNRAVIKFEGCDVGIYLHWNGGRDSVEPFLEYCRLKEYRSDDYGVARMAQVIGNFFGGGLSLGVISTAHKSLSDLNPGDNGVYVVKNWEIVGRYPFMIREQNEYDRKEFLAELDKKQPTEEQFGEDFLNADEIEVSEIKVGDLVFESRWDGEIRKGEVIGFGEDMFVNGMNVKGLPYTNFCGNSPKEVAHNINNYLTKKRYRVRRANMEPDEEQTYDKE